MRGLWRGEYLPYRTMLFFAVAAARAQTLRILSVYSGFINSNHAKEIDGYIILDVPTRLT